MFPARRLTTRFVPVHAMSVFLDVPAVLHAVKLPVPDELYHIRPLLPPT